ncbi:MAG: protein kinase/lanthionine synthetase C family protein [Lysobacter sp.]|nr:protein kinase/lanthionine synthetase C family protein [Lysobacter sp.]
MSHPVQLFHQPDTAYQPEADYRSVVLPRLPRRWRLLTGHMWTQVVSPIPSRLTQGWKIHLSATLEDAVRALEIVTAIAPARQTEFKFAADPARHLRLLSKNVPRQTGGKFITIYPSSDELFGELLETLHAACGDLRGPYVLSDSPYKDSSVLSYRYGGFHNFSEVNVFHERKSLVLDGNYRFVEDQRLPNFVVPPFARTPSCVLDADASTETADGPPASGTEDPSEDVAGPVLLNGRYEVLGVLKQSNIGGVYLARDRESGEQLVLREARPFTDPDLHGQDAVVRRRREYEVLRTLDGLDLAPRAIDFFEEWRHSFLVISHVPGRSLRQIIVGKCATLHSQSTAADLGAWFGLAHRVAIDLIGKVQAMHARGVVYGDVSTNNIIEHESTGRFVLIDFETAFRPAIDRGHNAFTPGYAFNERLNRPVAELRDDVIGIGAVLLAMLCPSACNLPLVDGFADLVFGSLERDYGLDPAYGAASKRLLSGDAESLQDALALLRGSDATRAHAMEDAPRHSERAELQALFADLSGFLREHVDLSRAEPLFGMDPGHEDKLLAFDHGLAGIAFVQCRLGMPTGRDLARHVYRRLLAGAETPGLLNGLVGGAWTCMEAGDDLAATTLLAACDDHPLLYADCSLGYGLAGIGLVSLRLWRRTGDELALRRVREICAVLVEDARWKGATVAWPGATESSGEPLRIGLHDGATGIALFLAYAYCALGDPVLLDTALAGLRHDLGFSRKVGVSIGFPKQATGGDASIIYPYLEVGTAGIVSVALRLHRLTGDAALEQFIHEALPTVAQRYTVCAGLGPGLAGLTHCLLDAATFLARPDYADLAWRTAGALRHFRVAAHGGAAMPARLGGTVSATYIDGTAGVALLLDRLLHGREAFHFSLDELLPAEAPSPSALAGQEPSR